MKGSISLPQVCFSIDSSKITDHVSAVKEVVKAIENISTSKPLSISTTRAYIPTCFASVVNQTLSSVLKELFPKYVCYFHSGDIGFLRNNSESKNWFLSLETDTNGVLMVTYENIR